MKKRNKKNICIILPVIFEDSIEILSNIKKIYNKINCKDTKVY